MCEYLRFSYLCGSFCERSDPHPVRLCLLSRLSFLLLLFFLCPDIVLNVVLNAGLACRTPSSIISAHIVMIGSSAKDGNFVINEIHMNSSVYYF